MNAGCTFESQFATLPAATMARLTDAALQASGAKLADKVAVYTRMVVWPALAESFRRDLVAVRAEQARRRAT